MAMIIRIEVPDLISNRAESIGLIITAAEGARARITISDNKVHPDEGDGWVRLCRDHREDETLDPDERWVVTG